MFDVKCCVVIVTYNGSKWLKKMLDSVLNSTMPVSIIVVDNHSTDDSLLILKTFSEVKIVGNQTNLGFGKANNIGIKMALAQQADYVFLLNQDTWIFPETIKNLIVQMEKKPKIGILSPIHLSVDEAQLDINFEMYYNRFRLDYIDTKDLKIGSFVNAAAWMMRKKCIETVGYFEPIFNHYGEDRNYCNRVLYHKFEIGILQTSKIVHDRTIKRSFQKDVLQSKYMILNDLLDINYSVLGANWLGFKKIFGLTKYFSSRSEGFNTLAFLTELIIYFFKQVLNSNQIIQIRNQSKKSLL